MSKRYRHGFTLIELLLVIVVILLLAGISFRIATLIASRTDRAKAVADLQKIANVLEEFYAEYGTYPPVTWQGPSWDHPSVADLDDGARSMVYQYTHEGEDPDEQINALPALVWLEGGPSGEDAGYHYGLLAYLVPRDRPMAQQGAVEYDKDSRRDLVVKERWAYLLEGVGIGDDPAIYKNPPMSSQQFLRIYRTVIRDPWGNPYRYQAYPPFLSYRLWSAGPDGADGTADDVEFSVN